MSTQKQLETAKRLVQARQYRKARKILRRVDHPTARKWERQLDSIAPDSKRPGAGAIVGYVVVVLVGLVIVAATLGWLYTTTDAYHDMTARATLTGYCALAHEDAERVAACKAAVRTLPVGVVADCGRDTRLSDTIDQMYALALCIEQATGSSL